MLEQGPRTKGRVILASVSSWKKTLNISTREPWLLDELTGTLKEIGIEKASFFDINSDQFKTMSLEGQSYLVVGGFPPQTIQAWISRALLMERIDELNKLGYQSEGRLAVFGEIDHRQSETFSAKAIVEFFGEENTQDFYDWQDEFCQFKSNGPHIDFYNMDWNISADGAVFGDKGHILTIKGINLARIQSDPENNPGAELRKVIFDTTDDEKYIPSNSMTCRN
jgi:hypothetical protein